MNMQKFLLSIAREGNIKIRRWSFSFSFHLEFVCMELVYGSACIASHLGTLIKSSYS